MHVKEAETILGFTQKEIGLRGNIYDKDDNLLAGDICTKDLYMTPRFIEESKGKEKVKFLSFLSKETDIPLNELLKKYQNALDRDFNFVVAEAVSRSTAESITTMMLPGVSINPHKSKAAQKNNNGNGTNKNAPSSAKQNDTIKLFDICLSPRKANAGGDLNEIISILSKKLKLDVDLLAQNASKCLAKKVAVLVLKQISLDDAERIEKNYKEWNTIKNAKGVVRGRLVPKYTIHFEDSTKRSYPKKHVLSNTIGYPDAEGNGVTGIEYLMNEELKESCKTRNLVLDGKISQNSIPKNIYSQKLNGCNVHLTIQYSIQEIVEASMNRLIKEHSPKYAYILMMNPKTGAIMALAQHPNFNYENRESYTEETCRFHALVGGYEPGSIMKGLSVSSAMDYKNLTPDTVIDCENGVWSYGGRRLNEHGHVKFGDLTLRQIIQKSSNIGSAKAVIESMSDQVFYSYMRAFGMGQPTYVGFFPETGQNRYFITKKNKMIESRGMFNSVEKWEKVKVTRVAIGHSIVVTPFQMVQAYSAIANNGEMMQPYIIDRIVYPDNRVVWSIPFKKGQPITPKTAQKIIECLCATTERGGTGTKAAVPGYRVAGKTGTAVKPILMPGHENLPVKQQRRTYKGSKINTASFIGFVPAEDPAFVLLITADEPSGREQYGGSVCGDHFAEIATQTLKLLQIPPTPEEYVKPSDNTGSTNY